MKCCINCFKDNELRAIIKSGKQKGDCDFCNSHNVFIYDIDSKPEIREYFEPLIDLYNIDHEHEDADLLKNILYSEWNIFSLSQDKIQKFLKYLLPEYFGKNKSFFLTPLSLELKFDKKFLEKNSILMGYQWEDFIKEIKEKSRFHITTLNKDSLEKVLNLSVKEYKKGKKFYRGRICTSDEKFDRSEMGAPPIEKATAGRINPEGISYLYLADSIKTTLFETRAQLYDYVSIGEFCLKEDIRIIDLTSIDKISPFRLSEELLPIIAINLKHLKKIENDISRPLRRQDSSLDYLPTQYICDFIKSKGFDGVEYKSAMHVNGTNIALFNQELTECINVKKYEVTNLNYDYK